VEKFVLKPVLSTWSVRQSSRLSDGKVNNFIVRVIGEGATGSLVVRFASIIIIIIIMFLTRYVYDNNLYIYLYALLLLSIVSLSGFRFFLS